MTALSAREREVAALLIEGKRVKAIGSRLGIATSTVTNHIQNIKRKEGLEGSSLHALVLRLVKR